MGNLVFIFLAGITAFAQQKLAPAIKDMETLYPKHKEVFLQCLNKYPSTDKSLGCVDSYKYLRGLCDLVQENKFEQRYHPQQVHQVYLACKLAAKGDNRLPAFFDLDAKSCVRGFETLSDRLLTYSKNKDFIELVEEPVFLYMYEKNSCKDYRSYVNFCNYVDGPNSKLLPPSDEFMPKPDINTKPEEVCRSNWPVAEGLSKINYDIVSLRADQKINIYEILVKKYRARLPAGVASAECEQVRAGYKNFGCAKFENILDGLPAWRDEKEMRDLRINNHLRKPAEDNSAI